MEGFDAIAQVLNTVDGFAALAVAVWVISLGFKRAESIENKYEELVTETMRQNSQNQAALTQLVRELTDIRFRPYDSKNSGLD